MQFTCYTSQNPRHITGLEIVTNTVIKLTLVVKQQLVHFVNERPDLFSPTYQLKFASNSFHFATKILLPVSKVRPTNFLNFEPSVGSGCLLQNVIELNFVHWLYCQFNFNYLIPLVKCLGNHVEFCCKFSLSASNLTVTKFCSYFTFFLLPFHSIIPNIFNFHLRQIYKPTEIEKIYLDLCTEISSKYTASDLTIATVL